METSCAARRWLVQGFVAALLLAGPGPRLRGADDFNPPSTPPGALRTAYDVVIAGAGTGGAGAAIQAARMGAAVLLLEETEWIGGQMLAAAVTAMDEGGAGNLVRGRGLYREFVRRIEDAYRPLGLDPFSAGRYTNTRVEPRVGRRILHAMLADAGRGGTLDLVLRARVVGVNRQGHTVTGVEIEMATGSGLIRRTMASRILIDATEWGDVLPLTGARYRAGNRTTDALDPARHIQENTWTAVIKQYPGGVPEPLRITQPPPGYAGREAVFARSIVAGNAPQRRGEPMSWAAFVDYRGMPDSTRPAGAAMLTRTHLNFTNDYPCTVAYLEDPAQRTAVHRAMRLRTLQLLHYLQNTLGRGDWSVADDEGFDTPYNRAEIDAWLRERPELAPYRAILQHFPVIPYVRESRRIVGLHTLRAREISRGPGKSPQPFATAVALGDYRLDLHGGRAAADLELDLDRLEDLEDAQPGRAGPFAIPGETLVPEAVDGLLAAEKNFSQTRLVNGATRMQPHTMNLGQAAGALAALAVREGVPPRRIDPVLVQRAVLAAGSTLQLTPVTDVAPAAPDWAAIQLVTVRGLLSLEQGRFAGARPLQQAELAVIRRELGGQGVPAPISGATVRRGEFAQFLAASGPEVTLQFDSGPAEAAREISRSEAAQVLADFLERRALSRLRGGPQPLRWDTVKPASRPPAAGDSPEANRHLRRLVAAGVIRGNEEWLEQAMAGRDCDGVKVAELLLTAARLFEPGATAATALDVLVRARILSAPDYWARTAIAGGRCSGKNVAAVIRNLAASEPVAERAGGAAPR